MAVLLDSGCLFAVLSAKDAFHADVFQILETIHEPIVLPVPAITEVAYLLGRELGPERLAEFIAELADSDMTLENPTPADYSRAAILIRQYADVRLDFIDALIVAIAERTNEHQTYLDYRSKRFPNDSTRPLRRVRIIAVIP